MYFSEKKSRNPIKKLRNVSISNSDYPAFAQPLCLSKNQNLQIINRIISNSLIKSRNFKVKLKLKLKLDFLIKYIRWIKIHEFVDNIP